MPQGPGTLLAQMAGPEAQLPQETLGWVELVHPTFWELDMHSSFPDLPGRGLIDEITGLRKPLPVCSLGSLPAPLSK